MDDGVSLSNLVGYMLFLTLLSFLPTRAAMDAFVNSMAAYSVVTYLLGFKDRHNGNIWLACRLRIRVWAR